MKMLSNLLIKIETKVESIRNKYFKHALTLRINCLEACPHFNIESFKNFE